MDIIQSFSLFSQHQISRPNVANVREINPTLPRQISLILVICALIPPRTTESWHRTCRVYPFSRQTTRFYLFNLTTRFFYISARFLQFWQRQKSVVFLTVNKYRWASVLFILFSRVTFLMYNSWIDPTRIRGQNNPTNPETALFVNIWPCGCCGVCFGVSAMMRWQLLPHELIYPFCVLQTWHVSLTSFNIENNGLI